MNPNIRVWFSADELAKLSPHLVTRIPVSPRQCRERAKREKWLSREVPGKGGPRGKKTEFLPPENILSEIHRFLSRNPDFFAEAGISPESAAQPGGHQARQPVGRSGKYEKSITGNHTGLESPKVIYVAHTELRDAPGEVAEVIPDDQMILSIAVNPADWRRYAGLNPERIKIIDVQGDGMQPTLQHGDQVLVDTACNRFVDDAVYAIRQGDVLRIKRIRLKLDGSIEIRSDNSHNFSTEMYSKEEAAAFNVFGKILPFKFGKFDL